LSFSSVSSDYVLLATTTVSSSVGSVSFDGYFSSTYRNYEIKYDGIRGTNTSATYWGIWGRVRRSNSDVTTSNYVVLGGGSDFYGGTNNFYSGAQNNSNYIEMNKANYGVNGNTSSPYSFNGTMKIYNPLSTDVYKLIEYTVGLSYYNVAPYWLYTNSAAMLTDATTAISGFTFYYSTGNIGSGTFKLYGIK